MSNLEEQYQKMIETLENTIKDKEALEKAKEQLDDIVSIVVDDCSHVLDVYDEKIKSIENRNLDYEMRISVLEEKLKLLFELSYLKLPSPKINPITYGGIGKFFVVYLTSETRGTEKQKLRPCFKSRFIISFVVSVLIL